MSADPEDAAPYAAEPPVQPQGWELQDRDELGHFGAVHHDPWGRPVVWVD